MKKLLMSSIVLTAFSLSIILFQFSCKKDANAQTTTPLTKDQILVQKMWKVDQLHNDLNGVYASYFSGGANTTGIAYENIRYTFLADGTGTYVDQNNVSHVMAWQFNTSDKREMTVSITGSSAPDLWQMVEISGNYLHATEHFTIGNNTNNLHSFRLIQIP